MTLKNCILEETKTCNECGECDRCDLDNDKICDDCCRCLGGSDYSGIEITEIIMPGQVKLKRKRRSSETKPAL